MRSVALIRGINVSGQKKVPMATLREALSGAGIPDAATYIQSGNVVAPVDDPAALAGAVQEVILSEFGFDVEVIGLSSDELRRALDASPFLSREPAPDPKALGYAFLASPPGAAVRDSIDPSAYAPDELEIVDSIAYIEVKNGFGRSKLSTNYIESRLGIRATMRNHRTLLTLIDMSS